MAMYKITFKDNKFIFINAVSASEARYKSTELSAPFMSIQK